MGDMPSIDIERRLSALEAENRALRSKIVELEERGGRKVLPAPKEQQSRVLHPIVAVNSDLPSAAELKRLRTICANEYPGWCDSKGYVWQGRGGPDKEADEEEFMLQFERSILALSNMRKLDKPDVKRYASAFVDHAQVLLRGIGKYTKELRFAPFAMSCFCMNVPVSGLGIPQCTASLGLTMFDGVGTAIDPGTWRRVLANGRLSVQHRIERIVEQATPVRVVYGEQVGYRD